MTKALLHTTFKDNGVPHGHDSLRCPKCGVREKEISRNRCKAEGACPCAGRQEGGGRLQRPPLILHSSRKLSVSPETAAAQRRAGLCESCSGDGFLKQISAKWREVPAAAEALASLRPGPAAAHPWLRQKQSGGQQLLRVTPARGAHAEGAAAAAASILAGCTDPLGFSVPRPGLPPSFTGTSLGAGITRAPASLLLVQGCGAWVYL